jgi:hypothetical protein
VNDQQDSDLNIRRNVLTLSIAICQSGSWKSDALLPG